MKARVSKQTGIPESTLTGYLTLLRQQSWLQADFRLFSYRNSNNREVDCLIELSDSRVIALEVKASSTVRASHFRHLEFLREELGDGFVAGIVLSTAPEPARFGDRMWALPISALWELGNPRSS